MNITTKYKIGMLMKVYFTPIKNGKITKDLGCRHGIIDEIKILIWKWLRKEPYKEYRLKPLDCSLCMSFWIGLI